MRAAFSFLQNEEGRGNGFVAFDEARTHFYWLFLLFNLMTTVISQPCLRKCCRLALNQSHAPGEQRLELGIPSLGLDSSYLHETLKSFAVILMKPEHQFRTI